MIVFLNFAPIEFMGGAERWMHETAQFVNRKEKTFLISVHPSISNLYSRLVLKRDYDQRAQKVKTDQSISLSLQYFLPWTRKYSHAKKTLTSARVIYSRFEILESLLLIFFGGTRILENVIFGIHFPLVYANPLGFFEKLHNTVYTSFITRWFLNKAKLVHVITRRDQNFLESAFGLKNIIYIPTSTRVTVAQLRASKKKTGLNILFVGELSRRKGVDILLEIIKKAPKKYNFMIAGNGPMSHDVQSLCEEQRNCSYYGFLQKNELAHLYARADVLLLPSRAEGFPLVYHEAMAHGLMIVNSQESSIGISKAIEKTAKDLSAESFLEELHACRILKTNKKEIQNYYRKNYSTGFISKKLNNQLFT